MHGNEIKTVFTYRPSPVLDGSFLIFRKDIDGALQTVGDYTRLDRDEAKSLTEKKVINLVTMLNGGSDLMLLGEETKSRLLFHKKPRTDASDRTEIVFYAYSGDGISKENAKIFKTRVHIKELKTLPKTTR